MQIYIQNKLYKRNLNTSNITDSFFAIKSTLLPLLWLCFARLGQAPSCALLELLRWKLFLATWWWIKVHIFLDLSWAEPLVALVALGCGVINMLKWNRRILLEKKKVELANAIPFSWNSTDLTSWNWFNPSLSACYLITTIFFKMCEKKSPSFHSLDEKSLLIRGMVGKGNSVYRDTYIHIYLGFNIFYCITNTEIHIEKNVKFVTIFSVHTDNCDIIEYS